MSKKIYLNLTKILFLILSFIFIFSVCLNNQTNVVDANFKQEEKCVSSVLIERNTGKVLFDNNSNTKAPIASVTKLMTILLTLEDIESGKVSLNDNVLVSSNANSMGGSQIFLDANQNYKLAELLKSVIVASANDSSVALAEYLNGSEANFVKRMNERAKELGMNNTYYSNCTGLPTTDGLSTAYDQAILLNKVLNYDTYHTYSSIWLEDFHHPSGRITEMTNTNKLSRFYSGCIGGKTGSTNQAKYCLAVGAERNNMQLIAVVLGAETSKERFSLASNLLNYGFDNFTSKTIFNNSNLVDKIVEIKGMNRFTHLKAEREYSIVCNKNEEVNFSLDFHLPNMLTEVFENQVVGNVDIIIDGIVVDNINLLSCESYDKATLWDYFKEIINS